jgi:hypothetical protein
MQARKLGVKSDCRDTLLTSSIARDEAGLWFDSEE